MNLQDLKNLIVKRMEENKPKSRKILQHIADQRFYQRMQEEYSFWLEKIDEEIKKQNNK